MPEDKARAYGTIRWGVFWTADTEAVSVALMMRENRNFIVIKDLQKHPRKLSRQPEDVPIISAADLFV